MNRHANGDRAIGNDLQSIEPVSVTRERVISAVYESVIRPELYDAFMTAWEEHIEAALYGLDADPVTSESVGTLGLDPELKAHFARAYEILEQLGRKSQQPSLSDQIGTSNGFAILATPEGEIVSTSPTAARLLGQDAGLQVLQDHLTAGSVQLLEALRAAVRRDPETAAPVVFSTDMTPRHLMARVEVAADIDGAKRPMLVIEALEYQWSDSAEAMLVNSFGLSRAEVDIVRNLLAGHSLREIAQMSGRSEHTVRNQAKAVLAKTGAPGQVDLIRLVVFLINQQGRDRAQASGDSAVPDEILEMSTGYQMQVFQTGPKSGRPVLFLHGMLDGMAPLRFLQPQLRKRNLRLIAPARPGFGLSDAGRPDEEALDVFVAHVSELIAGMKLRRPMVLGHMAGALYGHVLARRLADELSGMVAVSGGIPIKRLGQLSSMARRQRVVAFTARFAPALLPPILRAGISQIDGKDIKGFMEALYKPGSHEHEVIKNLKLAGIIQTGYRFSVHQGHTGFAQDSHYVVRDWSAEIAGQTAPVIYLNGRHDPVVSAEHVQAYWSNNTGASMRVLPDAGQLALYEEPDTVFDALQELMP